MVDEVAAFTIPCCVHGYHVYQHMCTPYDGYDLDNASDCYAEYQR